MSPLNMGFPEMLVSCVVLVFSLGIPFGILYLLFAIYRKINHIEDLLRKNRDQ